MYVLQAARVDKHAGEIAPLFMHWSSVVDRSSDMDGPSSNRMAKADKKNSDVIGAEPTNGFICQTVGCCLPPHLIRLSHVRRLYLLILNVCREEIYMKTFKSNWAFQNRTSVWRNTTILTASISLTNVMAVSLSKRFHSPSHATSTYLWRYIEFQTCSWNYQNSIENTFW